MIFSNQSRRDWLKASGALSLASLAVTPGASKAETNNLPPDTPVWTKQMGAPVLSPAYGSPSEFEQHVTRALWNPGP